MQHRGFGKASQYTLVIFKQLWKHYCNSEGSQCQKLSDLMVSGIPMPYPLVSAYLKPRSHIGHRCDDRIDTPRGQ